MDNYKNKMDSLIVIEPIEYDDLREFINQIRHEWIHMEEQNIIEDEKELSDLLVMQLQLSRNMVAIELCFKEEEAVDCIAGTKFRNGSEAYVLDEVFTQPLGFRTLKTMISKHKQIKNPFTREEIKRILKVKIKYEAGNKVVVK